MPSVTSPAPSPHRRARSALHTVVAVAVALSVVVAGAVAGAVGAASPAQADGTGRTYTGTSDPSVEFTVPTTVTRGEDIVLSGTGWKTADGSAGSVVAVKIDDGAISPTFSVTNPADGTTVANPQVFAVAEAKADGSWSVTVPYPTTSNSTLTEDWAVGEEHSIRLLTGSLRPGDKPRTETASFTVAAAGSPTCDAGQVTVTHTAGGQTAMACVEQAVTTGSGRTIAVAGHGWLTTDGSSGSTVVLKLTSRTAPTADDFQFVHTGAAGDAILKHPVNGTDDPTIWAVVKADADGDFDTTIPVPQERNVPSTVDADAGALAAGHKLVVHLQSGLLAGDTAHTVDSPPLVVDGTSYAGDQTGSATACRAPSDKASAHVVYPTGQKENATTGPIVGYGDTIELVGTGWCNSVPENGGSTIAVKIDEGAYSHRAGELVNANAQVWQIIKVDSADGSFDVRITLPTKGEAKGGSTPAFPEGSHTLRLLTGSLKDGDPVRTVETGPFTVGSYRPNGLPDLLEATEDLTTGARHGVTATVGTTALTVTIPGARTGDWAFLTAYLPDGSVRYPWGATWLRTDSRGVATATLTGVTLPSGTWKLAVQGADSGLLGWAPVSGPTPTGGTGGPDRTAGTSRYATRGASTTGSTPTVTATPGARVGAIVPSGTTTPTAAPTSTPKPPVADSDGLTAANAGGVTGSQQGSVVTVGLPSTVKPGDWVFVYVYSTPTPVAWVQVNAQRQVSVDLGLMPAGPHKVAVLDRQGKLIGWTSATVGAAQTPAATTAGATPDASATGTAQDGSSAANAWLIGIAVALLAAVAATVAVIRRRRALSTSAPAYDEELAQV